MIGICFWGVAVEISQTASVTARAGSSFRCNAKDEGLALDRHFGAEPI